MLVDYLVVHSFNTTTKKVKTAKSKGIKIIHTSYIDFCNILNFKFNSDIFLLEKIKEI